MPRRDLTAPLMFLFMLLMISGCFALMFWEHQQERKIAKECHDRGMEVQGGRVSSDFFCYDNATGRVFKPKLAK